MKKTREVFMPRHIELRRIWEERIQNQKASGLTIKCWCQEYQISPYSFFYWKRRIFPKTLSRGSFIEIADSKDTGIAIEIDGVCIHLEKHFDPSTLKRCLEVLKTC